MSIESSLNLNVYNQQELTGESTNQDASNHHLDDRASRQYYELLDAARQLINYYKREGGDQKWAKEFIDSITKRYIAISNEAMAKKSVGSAKFLSTKKVEIQLEDQRLQQALASWAQQNGYKSTQDNRVYGQLKRLLEVLKKLNNYSGVLGGDQEWARKLIDPIADKFISILENHSIKAMVNQRHTDELIDKINNILRNKAEIVLDNQQYAALVHFAQQNGYKSPEAAASWLILERLEPIIKNKKPIAGTPSNVAFAIGLPFNRKKVVALCENSINLQ